MTFGHVNILYLSNLNLCHIKFLYAGVYITGQVINPGIGKLQTQFFVKSPVTNKINSLCSGNNHKYQMHLITI